MLWTSESILNYERHPVSTPNETPKPGKGASPDAKQYLPLGIDMAGIACLIVGGGRVGARKAETLASYGAKVSVLAPVLCERLALMVSEGKVLWRRRRYAPEHLDGFVFVIAATSDSALNIRIGQDSERLGVFSCVASAGRFSRVIFPARHEQDGLTVAVHSSGRDCRQSKRLRDELAAILRHRNGRRRLQLGVISIKCGDVLSDLFRSLLRLASDEQIDLPVRDVLVLATCRRFECYFLSETPRADIGEIRRFLLRHAGKTTGNQGMPDVRQKQGPKAYHHLLRVLSGLDSPLLCETEIVGQVKSALCRQLAGEGSPLAEIFASAMQSQSRIRKESGLVPAKKGWVEAVIELAVKLTSDISTGRTLVVGCGKIGTALVQRLGERGLTVTPCSKRAGAADPSRSDLPPGTVTRDNIGKFLGSAEVLILCEEVPPREMQQISERVRNGGVAIIDLEGGHDLLRRAAGSGAYFGPEEIGGCVGGKEAARIATAENLVVKHTILWQAQRRPPARFEDTIRIVGRPSALSKVQLQEVVTLIESLDPSVPCTIATKETPGDRDRRTPLPEVEQDDFFTREVDEALLTGQADLAVHSAKDLPARPAKGLCVAAILPSVSPWECLVSRNGATLSQLPPGALVGTSSERRRAGLAVLRSDLLAENVRGNVPERIRQMDAGRFDALLLAAAGLIRLGMQGRISEVFSTATFPPAPGQGSLALVVREDDMELRRFLEPLDLAERWQ